MARTDNQVRTELFKLAIELVDDRAEKEIERLQNDAALGDGTYTVPEDTRVVDAQTITRDLFEFYAAKGGDDMLESIKQSYELANNKYQEQVDQRVFNAVKTDPTGTEILSRKSYSLPTDTRVEDTKSGAAMFYTMITTG